MNKYKLLAEIMALSMLVNEKTKATVFVNYSGHVNQLTISLHTNGWLPNTESDIMTFFYLNRNEDIVIKDLQEIKKQLNKILIKGNVDMTKLPYEIEVIEKKHYSFI